MMAPAATLSDVLDAAAAGSTSVGEIARRTGLSASMVRVALDRLSALRMLQCDELPTGCPASGCSECPAAGINAGECPSDPIGRTTACFSVASVLPTISGRSRERESVREGGVEPPRPCGHTDLNRARLPIPPLARDA